MWNCQAAGDGEAGELSEAPAQSRPPGYATTPGIFPPSPARASTSSLRRPRGAGQRLLGDRDFCLRDAQSCFFGVALQLNEHRSLLDRFPFAHPDCHNRPAIAPAIRFSICGLQDSVTAHKTAGSQRSAMDRLATREVLGAIGSVKQKLGVADTAAF